MTRSEAIAAIEEYYRRLDAKDLDGLMALLTPDVHYSIETEQLNYRGRDGAVRDMFARLYKTYDTVWHGNYRWAVDTETGVVGVQLEVINTDLSGAPHNNHNSSFFHLKDGKVARVDIYIGGAVPKQHEADRAKQG